MVVDVLSEDMDCGSWIDCAGKLSFLTHVVKECNSLFEKVTGNDVPNPIFFLTSSIELISDLKNQCELYIDYSKNILSKELTVSKVNSTSTEDHIIDKLLDHDPGKRGLVKSASQRNYIISLGPFQPHLPKYPCNSDIKNGKQRQFNPSWYKEYPHLEYSISSDAAFCFVCSLFPKGPHRTNENLSWSQYGVRNWEKMKSRGKNKSGKLECHFSSLAHKSSLIDLSNFSMNSNHIDKLLNTEKRKCAIQACKQKEFHKDIIKILFDVTRTLARQGLPFRGDGDEKNGNFYQIILLISRYCPAMKLWLEEEKFRPYHVTYMSHESQDEFIQLLATEIKRNIVHEVVEAGIYSVMAD